MAEFDLEVDGDFLQQEICRQWSRLQGMVDSGDYYLPTVAVFDSVFYTNSRYKMRKCKLVGLPESCCLGILGEMNGKIRIGGVINYIFQGLTTAAFNQTFSAWEVLHTGWNLLKYRITPFHDLYDEQHEMALAGYRLGVLLREGACECTRNGVVLTDKYLEYVEKQWFEKEEHLEWSIGVMEGHSEVSEELLKKRRELFEARKEAAMSAARECIERAANSTGN